MIIVAKVLAPKPSKAYQGKTPKVEKEKKAEKAVAKTSYRPSPPSTEAGRVVNPMHLEVEAIIRAMRFSFSKIGDKAFALYQWSPHCATAIAQIKLEQQIADDDDF